MTDKEYYLSFWKYELGTPEAEKAWADKVAFTNKKNVSAMVMVDIQPYKSMIDGTMIESRSKHRSHLKQHNCIEIGNETSHMKPQKPLTPPPGLKETLIRTVNEKLSSKRY